MEKLYSSKIMFENGWWEDASPHTPESDPACTDNNVSYHYSNQPIWLQYDVRQILLNLFQNNSTYCNCTVWTLHFKNKGSVSKGGRFPPPNPPWVRHCLISCGVTSSVLVSPIIRFYFVYSGYVCQLDWLIKKRLKYLYVNNSIFCLCSPMVLCFSG